MRRPGRRPRHRRAPRSARCSRRGRRTGTCRRPSRRSSRSQATTLRARVRNAISPDPRPTHGLLLPRARTIADARSSCLGDAGLSRSPKESAMLAYAYMHDMGWGWAVLMTLGWLALLALFLVVA